jgi:hypothetical protein
VSTQLLREKDWVDFLVESGDPLYQERLVKMGWHPLGEGRFSRKLSAGGDVDRAYANFTRHIVEMIEQSARLRPIRWQHALEEVVDRLRHTGVRWWLYGSGALAVRGVEIEPGDLDLAVDDAYAVGEAMADLLVAPVTRTDGWVAEAGGRAFHGALIEWLSGAHPTGSVPPHEQEPAAGAHLESVSWHGRVVPVPRLELQLAVARRRGLEDRAMLIERAIGCAPSVPSTLDQ